MNLTTLKIALRDLKSSWRKFLFVVLAVAAGVGALTGVRGFSESFREMLSREARTLIASDVFVRIFAQPTPEQSRVVASLRDRGVWVTLVTETVSMVASEPVPEPVLVTLKSVDPKVYPFYGAVELASGGRLADRLNDHSVVVSDDLLLRLQVKPGDDVRIGEAGIRRRDRPIPAAGGAADGSLVHRRRISLSRPRPHLARGQRAPTRAPLGGHRCGVRGAPGVGAAAARGSLGRRLVAGGLRRA